MEEIKIKKDWLDKVSWFLGIITFIVVTVVGGYLSCKEIKNWVAFASIEPKIYFTIDPPAMEYNPQNSHTNFFIVRLSVINKGDYTTNNWNIVVRFDKNVKIEKFDSKWTDVSKNESERVFVYHGTDLLLKKGNVDMSWGELTLGRFKISIPYKNIDENGNRTVDVARINLWGDKTKPEEFKIYFDWNKKPPVEFVTEKAINK